MRAISFRARWWQQRQAPVSAQVTITLPSGEAVHATITHASCDALGLAKGVAAGAVIKAPLVILGVPA